MYLSVWVYVSMGVCEYGCVFECGCVCESVCLSVGA